MTAKLVPSDAHVNFELDKKQLDDATIGQPNDCDILCDFCDALLIPEGQATKVKLEVDLIQNTQREYDSISTYWHVDTLTRFQNIEVHQIEGGLKYLCCLSCQSSILGYQVIKRPKMIFIACDRVKEQI